MSQHVELGHVQADGVGAAPGALDTSELATAGAFLRLLTPTRTATYFSPGSYGLKP